MDHLKERLQNLAKDHAAGRLSTEQYQRLCAEIRSALEKKPQVTADKPGSGIAASRAATSATLETSAGHSHPSSLPPLPDFFDEEEMGADTSAEAAATIIPYLEVLEPGLEIGPRNRRFRLLRKLGEDATSRVWLAEWIGISPESKGPIHKALKIFAPRRQEDGRRLKKDKAMPTRTEAHVLRSPLFRIRGKAAWACRLQHPHIVAVDSWWQGKDGWPFVEMEVLNGQNLAQFLRLNGKPGLDWQKTLIFLRPIVEALDYAHQYHRLSHRNLKPENVFITTDGIIKVLDFGLTYQPREGRNLPQEPDSSGPVSNQDPSRFRQDICALAALTYQLLMGKPPYNEKAALGQDPHTWPVLMAGRPAELPSIQPLQTPSKPDALTDAAWQLLLRSLDPCETRVPTQAGVWLQQLEAAQPRSPLQRKSVVLGLAGVGAGLLLLLGVGVFYRWQPTPTPDEPVTPLPTWSIPSERKEGSADEERFAAAQRLDNIEAYHLYLRGCGNATACAYRQAALDAITRIQQQTALAQRNAEIEQLKIRFTQRLANRELDQNQQAKDSAQALLERLKRQLPAQDPFLAEAHYQLALAYAQGAQAHYQAGRMKQAREWIAQGRTLKPDLPEWASLTQTIQTAEQQATDLAAYQTAQRKDNRPAYLTYLRTCEPLCRYRDEAVAAIDHLKSQPPSAANPVFWDALKVGGFGPDLVRIPAGTFQMGSPDNDPERFVDERRHTVRITQPFALGQYEVTFDDYDRFADNKGTVKPDDNGWGRGRRPVINVTLQEALLYTQWLSEQTGYEYRLPTEAEWEYAARAGTTTSRYWGTDPNVGCRYANGADLTGRAKFSGWVAMNCEDRYVYTAPIGQFQPNAWELYDMLGNVLEWTCSAYSSDYAGNLAQRCIPRVEDATQVIARGGSWNDEPRNLRASDRYRTAPTSKDAFLGFRVVRTL